MRFDVALRSQEKNDMTVFLSWTGLRYNDNATVPGAQTERRGEGRTGEGSARVLA
jgi:hypothetical protein